MPNYTLTYDSDQRNPGWISFYSYFPEKILGMNNFLYTFKDGQLYRHNVNATRNRYYDVNYDSKVTSVVNQRPLVNKVFKTFYLESDSPWSCEFTTDKIDGFIDVLDFELKESDYFAYIRTDDVEAASPYFEPQNFQLRNITGINIIDSFNAVSAVEWQLIFAATLPNGTPFELSSYVNVGDVIYNQNATTPNTPVGIITAINTAGTIITVNPTTVTPAPSTPVAGDFMFNVKNSVKESNGLLGHYLQFTITNSDTTAVELFAVASDAMDSYPIG